MGEVFVLAGQNTAIAIVLALCVYSLTRVWNNPPAAHFLWLLVLLKLVAPPAIGVGWPAPRPSVSPSNAIAVDGQLFFESPAEGGANRPIQPRFVDRPMDGGTWLSWDWLRPVLFCLWLGGAAFVAMVAARRIVRFERLLPAAQPAPERLQRLASEAAARLGVRRVPDVRNVECVEAPFLWCIGRRATIVLPPRLLHRLDDEQATLILAHELAHLRRRDHWVRFVELIVSTIYWWNPLAWLIRRQIHRAEDICCDAWVRYAFPNCAKSYASLLLETAEALGKPPPTARLLPASPFLRSLTLKARIEMIIDGRFSPRVSKKSALMIATFAFAALLSFRESKTSTALAAGNDKTAATSCDTSFLAERFKYRVPFEIGDSEVKDGGRIDIKEVWGTRPKIEVGGQYLARGKYVLPHGQQHGKLYFYTTASGPGGQTVSLDLQSTDLDKPEGEFALVHGMADEGYFHLHLSAPENYSRWWANVYFGTGDTVYRANATHSPRNSSHEKSAQSVNPLQAEETILLERLMMLNRIKAGQGGGVESASNTMLAALLNANAVKLPHRVQFERGKTQFLPGDMIAVTEVRGTADTFSPGNLYCIQGTFTLDSHDGAILAAYTTAKDAANARGPSMKVQMANVKKGAGKFTLYLPMSCEGRPHVSFYPADGGGSFGGAYIGTGDSVLKK